MDLITTACLAGLAVAAVATIVCGGAGFGLFGDICVGIAGAFAGGWAFHALHWAPLAGAANNALTAAVGAVVLLAAFRLVRRTQDPARR
jgi:uncharacterized membrane protein YeaQ/YmgE (transglycosylase-associated protein family)